MKATKMRVCPRRRPAATDLLQIYLPAFGAKVTIFVHRGHLPILAPSRYIECE